MRVGIIALLEESNTFLRRPATLQDFERDVLAAGESVRERFAGAPHEVGGSFAGLAAEGIEAVPVFAARALPAGVIAGGDFERLLEMMFEALDRAGPVGGILAAVHGATVSEKHPDADGYWLGLLKRSLGGRVPIIATLDLHANLSPRMVDSTDALIAYRTNPHLDQRQRGVEAASLMARALRGDIRPVQAASFPPLAINIESQLTSEPPCRNLMAAVEEVRARPGVLAASAILGFPFADVQDMGSSAVVVADGDLDLARRLAGDIGKWMWDRRQDFQGRLVSVDEALAQAGALAGPVALLDMGDNVGGGSPGDGTLILHAIRKRGLGPALACIFDPASVAAAERAGAGHRVTLRLGGRTDHLHGEPLAGDFTVIRAGEGRFDEPDTRHGGFQSFDQGRTAVVEDGEGLTVILGSQRVPPFSLRQLTSAGVEPSAFRLIVVKGVHAPVAAYASVARSFIRVDTPGVTSADMMRLDYRRRRRPLYPLEPGATWEPP